VLSRRLPGDADGFGVVGPPVARADAVDVERMLRISGRRIDMSTPSVDAILPDGRRLHVVIPT
jgi:hypothetical protein